MKSRNIIIFALILITAALIFSACNKNDGVVYVTDAQGNTVLDALGRPVTMPATEDLGTSVVVLTDVKIGEDGVPVTDENGSFVFVPKTEISSEVVTDKHGDAVTELVTDSHGASVTDKNGENITEKVTVIHSVEVTQIVEVTTKAPYQSENNPERPEKTTAFFEDPNNYTENKTNNTIQFPTNPALPSYKVEQQSLSTIGGAGSDRIVDIEVLPDGSTVRLINTTSKSGSFIGAPKEMAAPYSLLVKFNSDGSRAWTTYLGGTEGETSLDEMTRLSDGSFIAVGYTLASDIATPYNGDYEAVIFKVSAKGEILWTKVFGSSQADYFSSVAACSDGGFVAGGKFFGHDGTYKALEFTSTKAVISKFTADGAIVWSKCCGGSKFEDFDNVAVGTDGSIYAAGESTSNDGDLKGAPASTNIYVVKFSAAGEKKWQKIIGGSGKDEIGSMISVKDGIVIVGSFNVVGAPDGTFAKLINRGARDAFIMKLGTDGSQKLLQAYGGLKDEKFTGVVKTIYGFVVCGVSYSSNRDLKDVGNKGECDSITAVLTPEGELVGIASAAGTKRDTPAAIAAVNDNIILVVGNSFSADGSFADKTPSANANCIAFSAKYKVTLK